MCGWIVGCLSCWLCGISGGPASGWLAPFLLTVLLIVLLDIRSVVLWDELDVWLDCWLAELLVVWAFWWSCFWLAVLWTELDVWLAELLTELLAVWWDFRLSCFWLTE